MTTKLNQIIAIEKAVKNRTHERMTALYQGLQKGAPLGGIARAYTPRDEEGEKFPSESVRVQIRGEDSLRDAGRALAELLDVTAARDFTNCGATADVVVDGKVLLKDAPATYLLFLEKQLLDVHALVSKLPVLDPSETWAWDKASACWATEPATTVRTKKVPRNHVKAEATKEHPAQVEVYYEDVVIGTWKTTKYSGALPMTRVEELTARVEKLQRAVKFAREQANLTEVKERKVGADILGYVFG